MARLTKPIALSAADKATLERIIKKGQHKSRKITRARALLLMATSLSATQVQAKADISSSQYHQLNGRYFAGGLSAALHERPRPGQPPKVTPVLEAQITSLACSDAPPGAARWTLSLLNDSLVSLHYIERISNETIRHVLKKAASSPGSNKCGALAR